jgi:hypothetical protein
VIGPKARFLSVPIINFQAMGSFKPITAPYLTLYIKPRSVAKRQCKLQWCIVVDLSQEERKLRRGQPLSLTLSLSLGERPWIYVRGEIPRCDRPTNTIFLYMPSMNYQAMDFVSQSQRCNLPPYIIPRNVAKRRCELQWLTPSTSPNPETQNKPNARAL